MEGTVMAAVVTAAGGLCVAALTGIISYRTARWNIRKDFEIELRRQRLDAFKKLWALSQPLAKYGRTEAVTPSVIALLSQELRRWYFEEGGMFLSDSSRSAYFEFQESLTDVIKVQAGTAEESVLDASTFESLRIKGSKLRTALRSAFDKFPEM